MAKRAIIGFKGVALAPITENTITSYKTEAAVGIPFAGSMSRTAKETTQDMYYDDALYAQIRSSMGDDVEIRFAEMEPETLEKLGYGTYDAEKHTLSSNYNVALGEYSLRCKTERVDGLHEGFNWRVFELTGIRLDNFTTKGNSITACEVIMTGVFKSPMLSSVEDFVRWFPADDGSNKAELDAWLSAAETLPKTGA